MCRSRRELSNEYLLAKIGVDTAENEPLDVWGENSIQYSLHSLAFIRGQTGLTVAAVANMSELPASERCQLFAGSCQRQPASCAAHAARAGIHRRGRLNSLTRKSVSPRRTRTRPAACQGRNGAHSRTRQLKWSRSFLWSMNMAVHQKHSELHQEVHEHRTEATDARGCNADRSSNWY